MVNLNNKYPIDLDQAEEIAAQALLFLSTDAERLVAFLNITGLSAEHIRENIHSRSFLSGVLDHLLKDESLLLAFCANKNLDPNLILPAKLCLDGNNGQP